MHRRILGLIGVAVLAFCATGYGATDDASMIRNADAYVLAQKFDRAQVLYERAQADGMHFDSDLPHARNLATVYLNIIPPDLTKAIQWLQVALKLDPQSDSLRAQLASTMYRNGNFEAAIDRYKVLVQAHPSSAEYLIPLGTALRQAGESDAALQFLRAGTEKFPNLVALRIEYARQLNFTKQFSEARTQFAAVLAIEPQNLIAQVGLAKAASYEGDQEAAIEMYDHILQRHPGSYDAIVGKAFSLLWSGRTEQAATMLRQASARNPEDHEVREALSTLPHAAGASVAVPEARNRRFDKPSEPREAALRRPPNPEKELRAAPSPDRVVPPLPENLPTEQKPQYRYGATLAVLGFLALLSFAYRGSHSPHRKSQGGEAESLSGERTPDAQVPMIERDSKSKPQSTVAMSTLAETETKEEINNQPVPLLDECASELRQPSSENSVAPPEPLVPVLSEEPCIDIVEPEAHEHLHPSATHPRETFREQLEEGGTSDYLVENHGPVVAAQKLEPEAKFKVMLIGGSPHEVELETRWFPIAANEILWERHWAAAVQRLSGVHPDLIVLNALSDDGRTSEEMFNWIIINKPRLRNRTIVIGGRIELSRREHYLVEPFGATQWRQAVMSVAQRQTRPYAPRVTQASLDDRGPTVIRQQA